MKVSAKVGNLVFEVEGNSQVELFRNLAELEEVFSFNQCNKCQSENVRHQVRTVDDNDFFEMVCDDCRARFSFGQTKKGNKLFPRKKDKDGNWLPDNGWVRWDTKLGKEV